MVAVSAPFAVTGVVVKETGSEVVAERTPVQSGEAKPISEEAAFAGEELAAGQCSSVQAAVGASRMTKEHVAGRAATPVVDAGSGCEAPPAIKQDPWGAASTEVVAGTDGAAREATEHVARGVATSLLDAGGAALSQ